MVFLHEEFGECLTAFKLCAMFVRAYDFLFFQQRVCLEEIDDAVNERLFRSNDDHLNVIIKHRLLHCVKISYVDRDINTYRGGACVTRGDKDLRHHFTLSYFPCESMFAATRA